MLVAALCSPSPLKPLRSLCVEPTHGVVLCSGSSDGTLHLWDLRAHVLLHTLRGHVASSVRAICFGVDGALYVAGSDSRVVLWRNLDASEPAEASPWTTHLSTT